ncbi:MAG TPA: S8 family peptidase [Roseiflexaceae bacterium]|nr:S8 family peptidase [Roseiflexaceae bacterium]
MHSFKSFLRRMLIVLVLLIGTFSVLAPRSPLAASFDLAAASYVVQAASAEAAAASVIEAGGTVTERLPLVNGVAATLDRRAVGRLRSGGRVVIFANAAVAAPGANDSVSATATPRPTQATATTRTQASATAAALPATAPAGHETDTEGYLLYPSAATKATLLHQQQVPTRSGQCTAQGVTSASAPAPRPLQGWGVTVAVIDSGFMAMRDQITWQSIGNRTLFASGDSGRCIIYKDFLPESSANGNVSIGNGRYNSTDQNGHGTHVISTIADGRSTSLRQDRTSSPAPVGVAPKVNLLIARALDRDGSGTYADVIAAIQWVIANKDRYNVRVLNLSLQAPVASPYWYDPLGQAVMRAWQSGLVVVVAAGNAGPTAGTVTVPGNVPYVITVGAIKSGRYTQSGDDELALYSSRGPTESAFVKPDVLVPASRTIAPMPNDSTQALFLSQECTRRAQLGFTQPCIETTADVDYSIGRPSTQHTYFYLSGTSMAAAEVSGIAALMLQTSPTLTNDQVKARLLATARPALDLATGQPAYSPWEQGAGLVDTQQAVFTSTTALANQGMDIALDLDQTSEPQTHYWGATAWFDPPGEFRLVDPDTQEILALWSGASRAWSGASRAWSGASRAWSGASRAWSGASRAWSGGINAWSGSVPLWAGASRAWSGSTPTTASNTAAHTDILVNDGDLLPPPTRSVRPILECVVANANGSFTAFFGYQSDNSAAVDIPAGPDNRFQPTPQYRGQPEAFLPGRVQNAFSVTFVGNSLVWTVKTVTVTASQASPRCTQ